MLSDCNVHYSSAWPLLTEFLLSSICIIIVTRLELTINGGKHQLALKNYSIRLDEEEYDKLKKYLIDYGDLELNIGFILRQYMRDLNNAIPDLNKSDLGLRFNLAFFGTMLRQFVRSAQLEAIISGQKDIEQVRKKSEGN